MHQHRAVQRYLMSRCSQRTSERPSQILKLFWSEPPLPTSQISSIPYHYTLPQLLLSGTNTMKAQELPKPPPANSCHTHVLSPWKKNHCFSVRLIKAPQEALPHTWQHGLQQQNSSHYELAHIYITQPKHCTTNTHRTEREGHPHWVLVYNRGGGLWGRWEKSICRIHVQKSFRT